MLGNAAAADLSQQAPLVEVIEEAAHRQSFTLAPSGLESQENRGRRLRQGERRCATPVRGQLCSPELEDVKRVPAVKELESAANSGARCPLRGARRCRSSSRRP